MEVLVGWKMFIGMARSYQVQLIENYWVQSVGNYQVQLIGNYWVQSEGKYGKLLSIGRKVPKAGTDILLSSLDIEPYTFSILTFSHFYPRHCCTLSFLTSAPIIIFKASLK